MLSTERMSKLKAIVLDQYSEDVIREFSKLGKVHITDIRDSIDDWKGTEIALADEKKLNRISELLGRIYYIMDVLGIKEEVDFFGSLSREPRKVSWKNGNDEKQLLQVETQFSEIESSVIKKSDALVELGEEKARLEPEKAVLENLSRLNAESTWLGESEFLYTLAGLIKLEDLDQLQSSLEKQKIEFILKEAAIGEKIAMLLVLPKENRAEVDKLLSGMEFTKFSVDKARSSQSLKEVRKRLEEIEHSIKHTTKELQEDKKKYWDRIFAFREVVLIEKNILEAVNMMAKTKRVYVLEGWVPKKEANELINRITLISEGCAIIKEVIPKKGEIPPSKMNNHPIFKPFEMLISTLGVPAYKEIDPTPIVALTFPLFYGLMFGDVGHGLILALIGAALMFVGKKTPSAKNLGLIVIACGVAAILFGFLYGEAFGVAHGEQEETLGFSIPLTLTKQVELHGELETVPLYSPMHQPFDFLILAVMVGGIHIGFGLFLNMVNKLKEGKIFAALGGPIPRIWLYYGLVYILITYGTDFAKWFENVTLLLLLIVVPLIMILLGDIISHLPHFHPKKIGADLGQGAFEAFDTGLIFMSNTISYTRIFALALVHGGLFLALFSITATVKEIPVIGFFVWFLMVFVGTLAIIALESIIVFLHSLRLHYYEWFTKFYAADGIKFAPFKAERVYTKLEGETE